jgi:hypothetical protein
MSGLPAPRFGSRIAPIAGSLAYVPSWAAMSTPPRPIPDRPDETPPKEKAMLLNMAATWESLAVDRKAPYRSSEMDGRA